MQKILLFSIVLFGLSACNKNATAPTTTLSDNPNFLLGNPSAANKEITNTDNYLVEKKQYVLSYNNTFGRANWVSWRSAKEWIGSVSRQEDFRPDDNLPSAFYKANSSSFSGTGFDRGHMCPSGDRTNTDTDNSATFYMTNMMPQAPKFNQGNWALLENYCRKLVSQGNELYIICGGRGEGGSGSNGGTTKKIDNGQIRVPSHCWKIIVVLPNETGTDTDRIDSKTRIIAIDVPNKQSIGDDNWGDYRLSIKELETLTGYDFFSVLPKSVQTQVESNKDAGPTQ